MKKISYNQLRKLLQNGFVRLLGVMPEGDEPVLDLEQENLEGQTVGYIDLNDPDNISAFLRDFSKWAEMLLRHHSPEEVIEIMGGGLHGAQRILLDDTDSLAQELLD